MRLSQVVDGVTSRGLNNNFTCPHCKLFQAVYVYRKDFGAAAISVTQCAGCSDIQISGKLITVISKGIPLVIYPERMIRPAKTFSHCPGEIISAYKDACRLYPVHTGASGAYARRALELILEHAGYADNVLAQSIKKAQDDTSEHRLPKSMLAKLEYIREAGNFALHIRRDSELTIIEISEAEVDLCLDTIEGLIDELFEEPCRYYASVLKMNEKLRAAGKKEVIVPDKPKYYDQQDAPELVRGGMEIERSDPSGG